ncbi:hypothetical protein JG687_00003499 [Phytophthora cactorum]|uniref:Uncharacterized protein n=1 Tax=Phytophthora cactorum TaxID=29920 RepID=A0A8T1UW24_9STRA|nr:hypothetical protein JG687_00003499 [Phytophthora cactorum]
MQTIQPHHPSRGAIAERPEGTESSPEEAVHPVRYDSALGSSAEMTHHHSRRQTRKHENGVFCDERTETPRKPERRHHLGQVQGC